MFRVIGLPVCAQGFSGKGIQAVLLEQWGLGSVTRLATVLVNAPGTIAVEVCPFQGKEGSNLENLATVIMAVAPFRPLIVIVHLGFHRDDPNFEAQFVNRIKLVRTFCQAHGGARYGANLQFLVSPMLEDEWTASTASARFSTLVENFGRVGVNLVRSSTVKRQKADGLTDLTNSYGTSFPLLREIHGHANMAQNGQIFSNDGNIVYSGKARSITWKRKIYSTVEDEDSYDNANLDDTAKYSMKEFLAKLADFPGLKMLWRPAYNGRNSLVNVEKNAAGQWAIRYDVRTKKNAPFNGFDDFEALLLADFFNR